MQVITPYLFFPLVIFLMIISIRFRDLILFLCSVAMILVAVGGGILAVIDPAKYSEILYAGTREFSIWMILLAFLGRLSFKPKNTNNDSR
jgi:hypothetical protein